MAIRTTQFHCSILIAVECKLQVQVINAKELAAVKRIPKDKLNHLVFKIIKIFVLIQESEGFFEKCCVNKFQIENINKYAHMLAKAKTNKMTIKR